MPWIRFRLFLRTILNCFMSPSICLIIFLNSSASLLWLTLDPILMLEAAAIAVGNTAAAVTAALGIKKYDEGKNQ